MQRRRRLVPPIIVLLTTTSRHVSLRMGGNYAWVVPILTTWMVARPAQVVRMSDLDTILNKFWARTPECSKCAIWVQFWIISGPGLSTGQNWRCGCNFYKFLGQAAQVVKIDELATILMHFWSRPPKWTKFMVLGAILKYFWARPPKSIKWMMWVPF